MENTTQDQQNLRSVDDGVILSSEGKEYAVSELDSYGFVLTTDEKADWPISEVRDGQLELNGSYRLPIRFCARRETADGFRCTLHDLTLAEQGTLDEIVQEAQRTTAGGDLQNLSYDQIAQGEATAPKEAGEAVAKVERAPRSRATLVGILLVAAMVVIAAVVASMVKGRSSLELRNGTLAGNYIPLSADMDCEVAELFVKEGDTVTAGQPLYRLVSHQRDAERELVRVELDTAIAEHRAAQTQVADYQQQLKIAERALAGRLAVVTAEYEQAKVDHSHAIKQVERQRPLYKTGAVKPVEYEAAVAQRDSLGSAKMIKQALIDQLSISTDALASGIIIGENGAIDGRKSDLDAKLSIASAKLTEARKRLGQVESLADPDSVVAPSDGTIYSLYRAEGEFVRSGDPVLSISGADANWAIGHIGVDEATKVRPGQRVYVNVPSVGVRAEGRVVSVGHRGLYAQGDWSADFRATLPTDVPIKVQLPKLPVDLPSGIRLDMVVTLDKVWPWQKRNVEIAWPGDERRTLPNAEPSTDPGEVKTALATD